MLKSRCNLVHASVTSIMIDSSLRLPRAPECGKVRELFCPFQVFGNHDMTMTRRGFVSASAMLAAAPVLNGIARGEALPRAADIVVIGAGAAGIAAARRIVAANRKAVVVESASAVGCRCMTDPSTFELPFDRGARWMHNPDTGPMFKLARAAGLEIATGASGPKIRIGRRNARPGETEEFLAALVRANRSI